MLLLCCCCCCCCFDPVLPSSSFSLKCSFVRCCALVPPRLRAPPPPTTPAFPLPTSPHSSPAPPTARFRRLKYSSLICVTDRRATRMQRSMQVTDHFFSLICFKAAYLHLSDKIFICCFYVKYGKYYCGRERREREKKKLSIWTKRSKLWFEMLLSIEDDIVLMKMLKIWTCCFARFVSYYCIILQLYSCREMSC
jgi:hypothetical protein